MAPVRGMPAVAAQFLRHHQRDPERAIRRMIKEANSLGLTVRFDPIEII